MDILRTSKKEPKAEIEPAKTKVVEEKEAEIRERVDDSQYGNAPLGVETFVDYLKKGD